MDWMAKWGSGRGGEGGGGDVGGVEAGLGGGGFMKGSGEHSRVGGDREINPAKRNLRGRIGRERGRGRKGGGGGRGRKEGWGRVIKG
jgi:hypothetical protein